MQAGTIIFLLFVIVIYGVSGWLLMKSVKHAAAQGADADDDAAEAES